MGKVLASTPGLENLAREIEATRQEIVNLEMRIQSRRLHLQGLESAYTIMGGRSSKGGAPEPSPLRDGLLLEAWRHMKKAGGRHHVDGILKALGKKSSIETRKNLSSQLRRNAERGRAFRKAGPNMYEAI